MCSEILESRSKLLQIKKEILGKSQLIKEYSKASESSEAYEDLLNTTSDFCSEMMFAVLSHKNGHNVSLNKRNDVVIDNNIAEVKSIHDKFDKKILDKDSNSILKLSLHDHFKDRGKRADEYIQILKKVWTDDFVEFKGQYYNVPASKVVQKPHIPIYLGGFVPNTF